MNKQAHAQRENFRRRRSTGGIAQAATLTIAALATPLFAANTYTWNNTGGTATDFNTAGNWTPNTVPGAAGNDIAAFTGAAATTSVNVSTSRTIGQITFAASTSGYDLTSSSTSVNLKIGGGSIVAASNTAGTNTIDAPIVLNQAVNGTAGISQVSGGTLVLSGQITSTNTGVGLSFSGGSTAAASTSNLIKITGVDNSFTGAVQIGIGGSGAVVGINSLGNTGGYNSSLGQGNITLGQAGNVTQYVGLLYTGAGETSNKIITLQTGAVTGTNNNAVRGIDTTGATGGLVISSDFVVTDSIASGSTNGQLLQLNGTNDDGDALTGVLGNGVNGKLSIQKIGTGTWTLGGTSANTYTGTTSVSAGQLNLDKTNTLAVAGNLVVGDGTGGTDADVVLLKSSNQIATASAVTLASSGKLDMNGASNTVASLAFSGGDLASTTAGGNLTVSAAPAFTGTTGKISTGATLTSATTATLAASGALRIDGTLADGLSMLTGSSLTGTGGSVGAITLAGNNTISGTLSTGAIASTGANSVSSGTVTATAATINSGSTLTVDGTLSSTTAIAINGTLKGAGTVGALSINSGGKFSPGNGPGTMNTGDSTYAGGGTYTFELNGVAGKGTAYDWQNITGQLNVAATSASKFTIAVTALTTAGAQGTLAGFDKTSSYAWVLATASSGFGGTFDASKFTINTAAFTNNNAINGTFALSTGGNDLLLTYTAVPEPASLAAIAGAALVMLRRRRQSALSTSLQLTEAAQ